MKHVGSPVASLQLLLQALLVSYGHQLLHMKLVAHKSLKCLPLTRKTTRRTTLTTLKSTLRTVNITVDISNLRESADTPPIPATACIDDLPRPTSASYVTR